ncbi:MAG: hypothetical protein V7646_5368 [Pseudonocardia sp.]
MSVDDSHHIEDPNATTPPPQLEVVGSVPTPPVRPADAHPGESRGARGTPLPPHPSSVILGPLIREWRLTTA